MVCRVLGLVALLALSLLTACGGGGGGTAAGSPAPGVESNGTLRLEASTVTVSAKAGEAAPERSLTVNIDNFPDATVYVGTVYDKNGLLSADVVTGSGLTATLRLIFKSPASLAPGVYSDTVVLDACLDRACTQHLKGSPYTVSTGYTVVAGTATGGGSGGGSTTPEPGLAALEVASRTTLAHDVVDAEFSRALNAVVMVSSWPSPALYVYDAATGTETRRALGKVPKALSLSPDGLSAAVGHDALVSYLRLDDASAAPKLLNVSADVGDLVLDARGAVHAFPASDQWVSVHSIDIASNTERLQYGPRAGTRVRLHPNGVSIYGANNGLSPDDIERYDISAGVAARLRDSPYHGDYPMCGNLWLSDDGSTIYTACGKSFRASQDVAQDMRYAGSLTLSGNTTYGYRILSLSHWAASSEIALIEQPWYECLGLAGSTGSCVSHLNIHDSSLLGRTASYSVPPVAVGSGSYAQQGLFVFHRNDGTRVLVSRLRAMPDQSKEFLLSIVR